MAYDKLVDSAKLDGALKITADAIRGKTGGTENIPWSETEGFKSAVEGITAGGGSGGPLQAKTAWPSHDEQVIAPDEDYYGLVSVKVEPVPKLQAVETRVEVASGVEYYYNHEQLPEIPADVVENYPYIVIMKNLTYTRIYASKGVFYYTVTDAGIKKLYDNAPGTGVRYTYNANANAWVLDSVATGQFNFSMNGTGSSWVIWWSNHDIPNGSPDSEEIYFPASEPQAEQPADATHFYYNGVRLPEIPKNVQENYTHYWIYRSVTSGYYRLICSNVPWYRGGDPIGIYDTASTDDVRYNIYDNELAAGAGWSEMSAGNYYYAYEEGVKYPLWSAQNILEGSADATEIYLYGTLAVPDPM